jgi:type II secretory pathway pseudopilin PulG
MTIGGWGVKRGRMFKDTRGLTLLELIVAMIITTFLGLALYNVCSMAIRAWQKGEARAEVYQSMRDALDRVSGEVRSAITLNPAYNTGPDGVAGNSDDPDIYFRGTAHKLDFIGIIQPPVGNYYPSDWTQYPPALVSDCAEIGYRVVDEVAYRRVQSINVPDSNIATGGVEREMDSAIKNLSFRYSTDGKSFLNEWDGNHPPVGNSPLPQIVEIAITARSASPRFPNERTFCTWVLPIHWTSGVIY